MYTVAYRSGHISEMAIFLGWSYFRGGRISGVGLEGIHNNTFQYPIFPIVVALTFRQLQMSSHIQIIILKPFGRHCRILQSKNR